MKPAWFSEDPALLLGHSMVRFLDRAEATQTVRKLESRNGKASPQITLFYTSGATDYDAAAGAITDALGAFGKAILICTDLPWGDHWKDDNKRWQAFYEWRRALGATARLSDVPGHELDAQEIDPLRQAIVWALRLGWDAELFGSRGRYRLRLSHNDWIEIFRVPNKRELQRQLVRLGFRVDGERVWVRGVRQSSRLRLLVDSSHCASVQ